MEMDVTKFVNDNAPAWGMTRFSSSQWESGPDVATRTWSACLRAAAHFEPLSPDEAAEIRDHVKAYGAWDPKEVDMWPLLELRAFILQEAAAEYREHYEDLDDPDHDEPDFEQSGGRLMRDNDAATGEVRWYFYVGE